MSNDEYDKINKLVEQQNIEAAFAKVKSISSGKKKLEPLFSFWKKSILS